MGDAAWLTNVWTTTLAPQTGEGFMAGCDYLFRSVKVACFVSLGFWCVSARAGVLMEGQSANCNFPQGLYNASNLGGGNGFLTLAATSSGEFKGVYRVMSGEGQGQSIIYHWLDTQTAHIACQGDTLTFVTDQDSPYRVNLTLSWNRALNSLEINGVYTGVPSLPRKWTKYGLSWLALGSAVYFGVLSFKHWQHLKGFGKASQNAGLSAFPGTLKRVMQGQMHDLALPGLLGSCALVVNSAISWLSWYSLTGHGIRLVSVKQEDACQIPPGVYRGEWFEEGRGTLELVIPVGQTSTRAEVKTVIGGYQTSYLLEPWRFECHGMELLLDWELSVPSSQGTVIAHYDRDRQRMIGMGKVAATGVSRFTRQRMILNEFIVDDLPLTADDEAEAFYDGTCSL